MFARNNQNLTIFMPFSVLFPSLEMSCLFFCCCCCCFVFGLVACLFCFFSIDIIHPTASTTSLTNWCIPVKIEYILNNRVVPSILWNPISFHFCSIFQFILRHIKCIPFLIILLIPFYSFYKWVNWNSRTLVTAWSQSLSLIWLELHCCLSPNLELFLQGLLL